jgi:hypothetical protein
MKLLNPQLAIMDYHGPIVVIGSILIVCGIQLLALGLMSELQVRHYYTNQCQYAYTVDRVISLAPTGPKDSEVSLSLQNNDWSLAKVIRARSL